MRSEPILMRDWIGQPVRTNSTGISVLGHSIVEGWEREIQEMLARRLCPVPGMSVLEVGYGLGMASRVIAASEPARHFLIEAHPALARKAIAEMHKCGHRPIIINAKWEDVLPEMRDGVADCIFFDSYPMEKAPFDGTAYSLITFIEPVIDHAARLLRSGGALGFLDFSGAAHVADEFIRLVCPQFDDPVVNSVSITPDPSCGYAKGDTANTIVLYRRERDGDRQ